MKLIIIAISLSIIFCSCKERVEKTNPITQVKNQERELQQIIEAHIKQKNYIQKNSKKGEPDFIITDYKSPMVDNISHSDSNFDILNLVYNGHVKGDPEIKVFIHFRVIDEEVESYVSMKDEENKKYVKKYILSN